MTVGLRATSRSSVLGPGAITEKELLMLEAAIPSGLDSWTKIGRQAAIDRLMVGANTEVDVG